MLWCDNKLQYTSALTVYMMIEAGFKSMPQNPCIDLHMDLFSCCVVTTECPIFLVIQETSKKLNQPSLENCNSLKWNAHSKGFNTGPLQCLAIAHGILVIGSSSLCIGQVRFFISEYAQKLYHSDRVLFRWSHAYAFYNGAPAFRPCRSKLNASAKASAEKNAHLDPQSEIHHRSSFALALALQAQDLNQRWLPGAGEEEDPHWVARRKDLMNQNSVITSRTFAQIARIEIGSRNLVAAVAEI